MTPRKIGIVMSGVTGRMGTNQHLVRSILAIIAQGGVRHADGRVLIPEPLLVGRDPVKLKALAEKHGPPVLGRPLSWTANLSEAIAADSCDIVFDASTTQARAAVIEAAARAGKAVYCEKPSAATLEEALRVHRLCRDAGVKHGVVQDKLFLPGIQKLAKLRDRGFFGRILGVRGDFGYWVFTGHDAAQPAQRPSWNYRSEDGGGILIDMFAHWRYVIDHTFGPVSGVFAVASTEIPERIDETGRPYRCTADDAAYAIFRTQNGVVCQFNSSWATRVRRDDLLTIQVDGTEGSAVAGLRECRIQPLARTPRPVWNPDIAQPIDFREGWEPFEPEATYDNAFKTQWEMFLRHYAWDEPWNYGLLEGAKGLQLAEAGRRSSECGVWQEITPLEMQGAR